MLAVMLEAFFGLIGSLGIVFLCVGVPYLSVKKYFEVREFYLDKSNRKKILKESYQDKSAHKKHVKKIKQHLKDLSKEKKVVSYRGASYELTLLGKNITYLKLLLRKMEKNGVKNQ